MSTYVIRYSPLAISDLQDSYDWGVENWGVEKANDWVDRLDELIAKRLSSLPLACPLAPEAREFKSDIRHLVVHRYRILFTVMEKEVYILRIRGPFSGDAMAIEHFSCSKHLAVMNGAIA